MLKQVGDGVRSGDGCTNASAQIAHPATKQEGLRAVISCAGRKAENGSIFRLLLPCLDFAEEALSLNGNKAQGAGGCMWRNKYAICRRYYMIHLQDKDVVEI